MLDLLTKVLRELPPYLDDPSGWTGEHKDLAQPAFDRLHRRIGEVRICLHRIYRSSQASIHTHPWPFAVRILKGRYEMEIATGPDGDAHVATVILGPGDMYSLPRPGVWHRLRLIDEEVWTVMVNGPTITTSPPFVFPRLTVRQVECALLEFKSLLGVPC